jgi:hypothetical protein
MAALQGGAAPWRIQPKAAKKLRNEHYAKGFKESYQNCMDAWLKDAFKVLRMARCAGMLAGLVAEWKGCGNPLQDEVNLTQLLAAMAMVKAGCADPGFRGKPCEYVTPDESAIDLLKSVWSDIGIGSSRLRTTPRARRPRGREA